MPERMTGKRRIPAQIGPTTPLRLPVAAEIAFPDGGVSVAILRRERDRENLRTYKIGNREFTTLAYIDEMIARKAEAAGGKVGARVHKAASVAASRDSDDSAAALTKELDKILRAPNRRARKGRSGPSSEDHRDP